MNVSAKLLPIVLFLAGCAMQSPGDLRRDIETTTDIPTTWMFHSAIQSQAGSSQWWRDYGSVELNRLVEHALAKNQSLAAAGFAWRKSRLAVDNALQDRLPSYNGTASANFSRKLDDDTQRTTYNYSASLGISYQVDLWGKLWLAQDNARWGQEASAEDLLATRLSLIGDVIARYLDLVYVADQLTLNRAYLGYAGQILAITRARYEAGGASRLDVAEAEQNLSILESSRDNLENQRQQHEVALSILLGSAPRPLPKVQETLADFKLPAVDVSVPARLLAQRPDLRAAQYRLQQNLGNIAIAERDFYPELNLGASLGSSAERLRKIFENPVGALTAAIALPFLNYHRKEIARKEAEVGYQQALANFRQTLYKALGEAQTALLGLGLAQTDAVHLQQRFAQAREIENLTLARYQAGAVDLQSYLEKQNATRNVEESLLTNRYQQLSRSLALHLALGGTAGDHEAARPRADDDKADGKVDDKAADKADNRAADKADNRADNAAGGQTGNSAGN